MHVAVVATARGEALFLRRVCSDVILLGLLLLAALGSPPPAQQQSLDVAVPGLSLHASLTHNAENEPMLIEDFSTDDPANQSVYCISGFFDVRYALRDASGEIVPENKTPWKLGSDVPYCFECGYIPGAPDPCKTVKTSQNQRRVLLFTLFPGLPRGKYTLQLVLAPRGSSERATSGPIVILQNDALPTWSLTAGAEKDWAERTLSLPHLRLETGLGHNGYGAVLFEGFYTDDPVHYSVYCRTAFADVQYELRDATGKIVPMARPWKPGTEVVEDSGVGYVPDQPHPCETVKSAKNERKIFLPWVYPNLPHGKYTLKITLAPRGRTDRAEATPFIVFM